MMAVCAGHMTKLQRELYKEKHGYDSLSRTFQSSLVHNPSKTTRITTYPSHYLRNLEKSEAYLKCPWGRARSYGGEAAVWLPTEHRPKCEPPFLLQRTHKHFGTGASPYPRGVPTQQSYQLTMLKRSNVRWNDELLPKPTTAQVHKNRILLPFPQENPLSSHMSRQAMFPQPDTRPVPQTFVPPPPAPVPPPVILTKAMGNFGRREIVTPQINTRKPLMMSHDAQVESLPMRDQFFSKHAVISQFNNIYPSNTPTIRLPIQKLRKADWKLFN